MTHRLRIPDLSDQSIANDFLTKCVTYNLSPRNLQCTDDDNRSYRNVFNMSFVSFSLAVIFIIELALVLSF